MNLEYLHGPKLIYWPTGIFLSATCELATHVLEIWIQFSCHWRKLNGPLIFEWVLSLDCPLKCAGFQCICTAILYFKKNCIITVPHRQFQFHYRSQMNIDRCDFNINKSRTIPCQKRKMTVSKQTATCINRIGSWLFWEMNSRKLPDNRVAPLICYFTDSRLFPFQMECLSFAA